MRKTNEQFQAEVFRRSAAFKQRKQRRIAAVSALAGFAAVIVIALPFVPIVRTLWQYRDNVTSSAEIAAEESDNGHTADSQNAIDTAPSEEIAPEGVDQIPTDNETAAAPSAEQMMQIRLETEQLVYSTSTAEITVQITNDSDEPLQYGIYDFQLEYSADGSVSLSSFDGEIGCFTPLGGTVEPHEMNEWTLHLADYHSYPLTPGSYAVIFNGLKAGFTVE